MQTPTHADTHALPQLTRTHTYTDSHTHGHRHTHTQKPTHYLNSLDLTLHTAHLTDNSHSDILRDEKCIRATRRLVHVVMSHPLVSDVQVSDSRTLDVPNGGRFGHAAIPFAQPERVWQ